MGKYYKKKRGIHGNRKAKPGDIVIRKSTGQKYVVVDHTMMGASGRYRVIPLTGKHQRFGLARWLPSEKIEVTGGHSRKAAVQTYRANEWLTENMGRTCQCQCCAHVQMDHSDFSRRTGKWRG